MIVEPGCYYFHVACLGVLGEGVVDAVDDGARVRSVFRGYSVWSKLDDQP